MSKYKHHKYTWTQPFHSIRHVWELVGPIGAVHFHVSVTEQYPVTAGLEFHHTPECGYAPDRAPDHVNCPLTGGRCWHDGTSMYATEDVWPQVEGYVRIGNHAEIFRILEYEADRHFKDYEIALRIKAREAGDE